MFLSSDSDTDSEWDSDSSDLPNGPMKQALEVNLKEKNKYDFANYSEIQTGDQFLLAVRKERKQIPKYTSVDLNKIKELKTKKLTAMEKTGSASSSGDVDKVDSNKSENVAQCSKSTEHNQEHNDQNQAEQPSSSSKSTEKTKAISTNEIASGIEKLNIEEKYTIVQENVKSESCPHHKQNVDLEKKDLASYKFLPTDLWRHDRLSQFTYMRDKIDNVRTLMQDGQFILVNKFSKSHMRDRTHWLRYCFGLQEASRMIETKRSSKLKAKAAYDASKKLKPTAATDDILLNDEESLTSGDEEDEVSDENSDLEFVSKTEVEGLEMIHEMGVIVDESDDLMMKTSGESLEELVVIPPQGKRSESTEPHLQPSLLQSIDSDTLGDDDKPSPVPSPDLQPSLQQPSEETPSSDNKTHGEISAAPIIENELGTTTAENVANFQTGNEFEEPCASTETGTDDSSVIVDVLRDRAEDEAAKREAHLNMVGRDPTVHLLLSMPTNLIEYLLTLHLEWVKEFGMMNRRQGSWLYSLMTFVPEPVDPSIVSDLRAAVPALVKCRDKAIQEIVELSIQSNTSETQSEASTSTEIRTESGAENNEPSNNENSSDFDSSDVLSTCNLFIALIIDFFGQKDLSLLISDHDEPY